MREHRVAPLGSFKLELCQLSACAHQLKLGVPRCWPLSKRPVCSLVHAYGLHVKTAVDTLHQNQIC